MKIPAPKGVITVFGNQQEARNIEKGHTPGQANVYQLKKLKKGRNLTKRPSATKKSLR
jgi:hypothetical protein